MCDCQKELQSEIMSAVMAKYRSSVRWQHAKVFAGTAVLSALTAAAVTFTIMAWCL